MSKDMRKRLCIAVYDAIADECIHEYADPHAVDVSLEVLDDRLRCPDCLRQAVASVIAALSVLADEHFDEDPLGGSVDYVYACEGLAQDVCDVLSEMRGKS